MVINTIELAKEKWPEIPKGKCNQSQNGKNRALDLSKEKFNRLQPLYKIGSNDKNQIVWHCVCDCGQYVDAIASKIKNGYIKSCGCLTKEINSSRMITTIPKYKKFRRLTYLGEYKHNENKTRILRKCKCSCGSIIWVETSKLLSGHTMSCGCLSSKGEEKISSILIENSIFFEKEKTFNSCRFNDTNALARFDFYIPTKNYLIEFDGKQHFFSENAGWNNNENLLNIKRRDKYKNKLCKENNIPLIRIPYTHYEDLVLEDLLLETSKFLLDWSFDDEEE